MEGWQVDDGAAGYKLRSCNWWEVMCALALCIYYWRRAGVFLWIGEAYLMPDKYTPAFLVETIYHAE